VDAKAAISVDDAPPTDRGATVGTAASSTGFGVR
jgi:hypothetical protein